MCRHVCPVGHVTSRETLTPHAWALTIESVRRQQLTWNDETAGVMFACADCGLCQTHCVTDQPLPDAIVQARADIVRLGQAPAAVLDFQRQWEKLAEAPRHVPKAPRILFASHEMQSRASAEIAAALRLLDAAGLTAESAGEQTSTGLMASALGLVDLAARLARDVVAAIASAGVSEVLVLGPADKWTFEYVYPNRLGVEWPSDVKVTEVTVALAEAHHKGALRLSRRLGQPPAYHDPCHGSRVRRDTSAPRRLLGAIYGDQDRPELFWRENRAHPCGAIGGLEITHPELAGQLAAARMTDAAASGAAMLVTDDPACLAHLSASADSRVAVVGLYGQLAQCI
jgi:Fe-S oxidoreductase